MTVLPRSQQSQPWIHSAILDSVLILLPPFIAGIAVFSFRDLFDQTTEVPLWAWVTFILCIDVAHVYSTIFRTYLNPREFKERKVLLTLVPLLCWLAGVILYSVHAMLFWRVLAYIAVFHFARQQYGFMMLYSRKNTSDERRHQWLDQALIYSATAYPIIFWHTHSPRNFHWFVEGDFALGLPEIFNSIALWLYALFAILYVFKEASQSVKWKFINIPKQLIIMGTALSWFVGIVALNGDMAFTITNVVSHGLPYMGLIWIFGRKQAAQLPAEKVFWHLSFRQVFTFSFVPVFLGILLGLAYLEEGLWDGLVWRDHAAFFSGFSSLPKIEDTATLAWLVPLLSLPQITHYVFDGFIWRLRERNSSWQGVVFEGGQREASVS